MSWEELINLILNSIQIIGIFIAIIIGLIISKVMELKKEKTEMIETIEDSENELKTMNEQFKKLEIENYNFYKEDNVSTIVDLIVEGKDFLPSESIPYISIKEQEDFYSYVKQYMGKVIEIVKNGEDFEKCKKKLNIKECSVEETIAEDIYDRRY